VLELAQDIKTVQAPRFTTIKLTQRFWETFMTKASLVASIVFEMGGWSWMRERGKILMVYYCDQPKSKADLCGVWTDWPSDLSNAGRRDQ
jgi:hypothetical protein